MNERILEILRQLETKLPGHPVYKIQIGPYSWERNGKNAPPPPPPETEFPEDFAVGFIVGVLVTTIVFLVS
jgi:hypothetical protein